MPSGNGKDDESGGLTLSRDPMEVLLPMLGKLSRRQALSRAAYSVAAAALPLHRAQDIAERTATNRSGRTAGMAEVTAVRDMIDAYSLADERQGGQHGRTALATYLRDEVVPLCRGRFRTEEAHRGMLSTASRGIHLLGWKAYDAGQQGLAQSLYLQSLKLAREGGLPGQAGFVMRTMALQGLKLRRPEHCLDLAEDGLRQATGRVDTQTEALFRVAYGHTLAKAGRRHAAIAEVETAHSLLNPGAVGDMPWWAMTWGAPAPNVHSRSAKVFEVLQDYELAAEHYRQAAAGRDDPYKRIIGLNLMDAGGMQIKQGAIEQACETWSHALDSMTGVSSARTLKGVRSMRRDLASFRARGVQCATQLDERAASFLTAGDSPEFR